MTRRKEKELRYSRNLHIRVRRLSKFKQILGFALSDAIAFRRKEKKYTRIGHRECETPKQMETH